jgi:acylphosphatase
MARELNLTGWVKNSWDGSVEVLLEGDRDAIDKMTSWFYKGPPSASVENVEIEWKKPTGEFDTFYVNY